MNAECNHEECKGSPYCVVKAHYKFYNEHCEILEKAIDPSTRCWKDGKYVHQPISLYFHGMGIHLNPDGTYCLEDTTGG